MTTVMNIKLDIPLCRQNRQNQCVSALRRSETPKTARRQLSHAHREWRLPGGSQASQSRGGKSTVQFQHSDSQHFVLSKSWFSFSIQTLLTFLCHSDIVDTLLSDDIHFYVLYNQEQKKTQHCQNRFSHIYIYYLHTVSN